MKLCFILAAPPAYSETFIVNKINGLSEAGFQVYFTCGHKKAIQLKGRQIRSYARGAGTSGWLLLGINILKMLIRPNGIKKYYQLERQEGTTIQEIIKKVLLNAHLLHRKFHWLHYEFGTLILGNENVAKAIGAKCAMSFRGFDILIYPLKYPGCYCRAFERVDRLHVISDSLRNAAIRQNLTHKNIPINIINPAIEIQRFGKESSERFDENHWISIGRLHWIKGYHYAFQAIKDLKELGILVNLTILGSGKEEERLKLLANDLHIASQVQFHGKASHQKVPEILSRYRFYLQPSLAEGFCNSVLEAQMAGLFCVVTDAEGLSENVIHGVTGTVVQKRNSKALADAMHQAMIMEKDMIMAYLKNAQNHVKGRFNLDNQIQYFDDFYR